MALAVNQQQPNLKHFCKICKKGFGCGRALGGHMRAHGIGDESWNLDDDEDAASDWEEKYGGGAGNEPPSTKRTYALRTNPKKSCRVCEHGKCISDEHAESSPVSSDSDDDNDGERGCSFSKRRRSSRAEVGTSNSTCPPSEEEDMAAAYCLMMLSNSNVGHLAITTPAAEPEESSASACRDEERRNLISFVPPISYCVPTVGDHKAKSTAVTKGLFECKACKKAFNSHQALGGHRASHKKVKGCFASRLDNLEDKDDDDITQEEFLATKSNSMAHKDHHQNNATLLTASSSSKRRSKVHECSICYRSFSSGQALGGHKRCHWITPNAPDSSTLARFQHFQDQRERMNQISKFDNSKSLDLKLDLNLPAPADDPARKNLATEIFLQPWLGETTEMKEKDQSSNINNNNTYSQCHSPSNGELPLHETENDKSEEDKNNNNHKTVSRENVEDEAGNKVKKLAKLSELKDMNIGGSSSPWLQVGIGSTTGVGAEP
ncbi:hypothetical protein QN277_022917 [Acacia crassicarpa]|uniref:C2H2-type domain-containing protein n=1 Tax=Acacia crassicarpa TaxID=499986 RepID=A0AAE1JHV9_9FABA|nr:hypothetical protein QN277_022917 [Acacia crassicarpa]